ncbi:MAG TPA: anhydro-N-acetylmuramic acid kinase [Chitinophagales bacterium]
MKVIGLMSGSSLDGVDLAYCSFEENNGKWQYSIEAAHCYEFDDKIKNRLSNATSLSGRELMKLNADLGTYFGELIVRFKNDFLGTKNVDLIASHGHTIFHFPEEKFTTQIGDASHISAITHLPVVADFRAKDVALGGNGAPVVPIGEKHLFADYSLFLNLGGIANISIHDGEKIIAFDVCAANQVLNFLAQQKGKAFDENGEIAKKGTVNSILLDELNSIFYYQKSFPKSLDNSFSKELILPILERYEIPIEDKLATYCEHIAIQLKNSLMLLQNQQASSLFITGGGAFNQYLISRIAAVCETKIEIPDAKIIAFKEALIIAFMGVLRVRGEVNILGSVTGANRDSVSGGLY